MIFFLINTYVCFGMTNFCEMKLLYIFYFIVSVITSCVLPPGPITPPPPKSKQQCCVGEMYRTTNDVNRRPESKGCAARDLCSTVPRFSFPLPEYSWYEL